MAFRAKLPDLFIPEIDVWSLIFERETEFPAQKEIYIDPNNISNNCSFHDVEIAATSFGRALRSRWNWQSGDVLAIFAGNCIDTPVVTCGALYANGVVSPINPAYTVNELKHQLSDCNAKAIITHAAFLDVVLQAGMPRDRILLIGNECHADVLHYTDLLPTGSFRARKPSSPSDLAYLVYSSGTTGLPKGVMLTHRNIVSNVLMTTAGMPELSWNNGLHRQGDTVLGVLPFYHIYGSMFSIFHPLYNGLRVVVVPKFTLESFCKAIQEHRITFGYVVPPILLMLVKDPSVANYDLSSIKMFMSAAAPLSKGLIDALWDRFHIGVKQAYGLSETSPSTHIQSASDWRETAGSVGRLLPNMLAKCVSEDGEVLPAGSTGEIWVAGPNVFAGYWRNKAATADALTADGYFRTGDIGHEDAAGNLFITDRLKELIKYKGFQVAPAELEGLLLRHPAVVDVCVVGVYDESQATELPRAFVVRGGSQTEESDEQLGIAIATWLVERVAPYKRLRGGVIFVKDIPKTASGKILRRVVRDQWIPTKPQAKL